MKLTAEQRSGVSEYVRRLETLLALVEQHTEPLPANVVSFRPKPSVADPAEGRRIIEWMRARYCECGFRRGGLACRRRLHLVKTA